MAAAAAAGGNDSNNGNNEPKKLQFLMMVMVTTRGPDGAIFHRDVRCKVFTFPQLDMLDDDTAEPFVQEMVEYFGLTVLMENRHIILKVANSSQRLLALLDADEDEDDDNNNDNNNNKNNNNNISVTATVAGGAGAGEKKSWLSEDGLPLTTMRIEVDGGVVSSVEADFEFERSSDESSDDDYDDDEDGDDGGVAAMEE